MFSRFTRAAQPVEAAPCREAQWSALFPALADLPAALLRETRADLMPLSAAPGATLFDAGMACQALPLVVEGRVKVSKRADNGREITLYHVRPGELCLVTVGCLLGAQVYPATGVSETELRGYALPRPQFMRLVAQHAPFREWVFQLISERMVGLMQLVEEVAFHKLNQRLAAWLLARAPLAEVSHQAIADELGSVREIVSRLLRQFEERGWVKLGADASK